MRISRLNTLLIISLIVLSISVSSLIILTSNFIPHTALIAAILTIVSVLTIISGITCITLGLYVIIDPIKLRLLHSELQNKHDAVMDANRRLAEHISKISNQNSNTIADQKKQNFLNIPSISFHFVNHKQIEDFYDEYFKEPTIESLVSEITGETSGEIKGSLPKIIEAGIGSKDISKWVSNIKVSNLPLSGKFLRYQRETITKGQVVLGIEEVDIELTELQVFEEAVAQFKQRFDLTFDQTVLKAKSDQLKEKAAEKTLIKLEQATGWILVEGKFKIGREGNFYRCTYRHPVNNYISRKAEQITISVILSLDALEEHIKGNYLQSVGRSIPLKIYGQVWQPIDRQNEIWDLQLTPLAIY